MMMDDLRMTIYEVRMMMDNLRMTIYEVLMMMDESRFANDHLRDTNPVFRHRQA